MVSGLGLDVSFVILDEQIKRKGQEETSREGMMNFCVPVRDIHIEYSKQFKCNLYFYVSGQSRPFWAALKLL